MTTVAPLPPEIVALEKLAEAFARAPTSEALKVIQSEFAKLVARSGSLSRGAIAALMRVGTVVLGGISAGAAAGTIGGPLLAFAAWAALFSALASARLPESAEDKAITAALAVQGAMPKEFGKGSSRRKFDCFLKMVAKFKSAFTGGEGVSFEMLGKIIVEYIECVSGKKVSEVDGNLMLRILTAIINSSGLGAVMAALFLGMPKTARAGGYTKAEAERAKSRFGLTGLPRGDGLAHDETIPPEDLAGIEGDPDKLEPWEADVDAGLDLGIFTDADLDQRIKLLSEWIKTLEKEAVEAGQEDTDVARRRKQIAIREANRLRKALDNAKLEKKSRAPREEYIRVHGLPRP